MQHTTIAQFNGGIINGIAATKIEPTAASDLLDADIRFGDLRPVTSGVRAQGAPQEWQYQDGKRSIVRFGEHYYWVDNETGELDSTIGYFGVDFPFSSVTLAGVGRGSRFTGRYRYTYTFSTAEGFESRPASFGFSFAGESVSEINTQFLEEVTNYDTLLESTPEFNPANRITTSRWTVYNYVLDGNYQKNGRSSTLVTGYNEGALVRVGQNLYRAKTTVFAMNSPSNRSIYKGGSQRTNPKANGGRGTPFGLGGTGDNGSYRNLLTEIQPWQYPETGSNSNEFWELLDQTVETERFLGFDAIRVTNIEAPSDDKITAVNIYRTVGDGTEFFLVASLAAGTETYIDTVSDEQAASGKVLNGDPLAPPIYEVDEDGNARKIVGRFLTEQLEVFYLASDDRVYLSEQSNPHAWDVRKFIELDDICTGLARYRDGVLAFTRNRTYQITGSTLADIRKRFIPEPQGCKDWRSIAYLNNNPTWISNDGLCQYGFVPEIQAELLQTLTVGKYDWPEVVWATVANRKYYGITPDNTAVIYDFERDGAISIITLNAAYALYDADNDKIIYRDRIGEDYWVGGGDDLEWRYESPTFTFGTNRLKRMRSLWFRCDKSIQVAVEVDGVQQFSGESDARVPYRRLFLRAGMTGTQFKFTLRSKGKLDQLTIEWDEVKR